MEVTLPNEAEDARRWVNYQLYKLPELSEYLEKVNCNFPSILEPNQSPNSKKFDKMSNASKKLVPISTDLADGFYESFHIKIPANLASIDYVMKSLSLHRRTQSINDSGYNFMNSPFSSSAREMDRCTSERWFSESTDKTVVKRKLPKTPSNFSKFSPELGSKSTGILRTKWKDGLPWFEFSVKGEGGEIYFANPLKLNNLNTNGTDYLYLFHKGLSRKKGLELVGMMKVSSSSVLNSDGSDHIETEFVLFGTMQSDFSHTSKKGFAKKALEILRPNYSFYKSKTIKGGKFNESSVVDESTFMNSLSYEFPTNYESCAIVTRNYQGKTNKEELISGGWGLKFLKKEGSFEKYEEHCKFNMDMSVLLPSGVHGSPLTASEGPSSLIERWKSGGLCDCGGWDLGCPINVLKNHKPEDLPRVETPNHCSIDLSVEGSRNGDSMFRLVNEKEGLDFVYFNPTIPVLQCFSVGIAFLHQQIPDLRQKL